MIPSVDALTEIGAAAEPIVMLTAMLPSLWSVTGTVSG